jgi:hypothetical protein
MWGDCTTSGNAKQKEVLRKVEQLSELIVAEDDNGG